MKKLTVLLISIMVLTLTGCSSLLTKIMGPKDKTFTSSGMSITLTDEFAEKEIRSFTACYDSINVAVFALKEEFSLLEGFADYSLKDYAQLVIENNKKDGCEIIEKDGLVYFIYNNESNGKDYKFFSTVHKGADSFWLIQLSCVSNKYDEYKDDFVKWAKSIQV